MENKYTIYSLSKYLTKANDNLSGCVNFIELSELDSILSSKTAQIILFDIQSIDIAYIITKKLLSGSNSQFICIDKALASDNKHNLLKNGIKYLTIENYVKASYSNLTQWLQHDKYKIMIVEDDMTEALNYDLSFEKAGVSVKTITTDIELLESINFYQPDILLMIANINEIAGDELVKLVRKNPEHLALPIVFLTSETTKSAKQKVLNVGANEVLLKPISHDLLTYKLIDRMQSNYFQKIQIDEGLPTSKYIYHTVSDVEHDSLVKFINEASDNNSASVIWIKIGNKIALQKKIGLSGFKNLCQDFLIQLPMFNVDFSLKLVIAEGIFALTSAKLPREQANQWVEKVHHWFTNNYFSVRKKEFNINIHAYVLSNIPKKSNNELLIYEAERLLFNSQSNQKITFVSEGEDQKHFYLIKTKLENAIKSKDFKWLYQSIINTQNENQEIFQLMLRVLTNEGKELKSIDYLDIANQTGLLKILDRFTLEQAIRLIQNGELESNHRCVLINQLISDYESELHRKKVLNNIKNHKLPVDRLVFQFRQDLTEEHTSLLSELGIELRRTGITVCLSEFDASPTAWNIAKTLNVHWLRIKPIDVRSQSLHEKSPDYLGAIIKKAQKLGYKVMIPNIDSANLTANVWNLKANFIHGNFIQEPVSDVKLLEENMIG